MKWLLILILSLSLSCGSKFNPDSNKQKTAIDKNFHLVIEYAQSSKVDVTKGVYTVFFVDRPPLNIKFLLSASERKQIIDKYYSLSIDELNDIDEMTGTVYIEDKCMIMPKTYTYVTVRRDSTIQKIQIYEECDDYSFNMSNKAKRVKAFLQYVDKIIQSKSEVKNAPRSNIMYI